MSVSYTTGSVAPGETWRMEQFSRAYVHAVAAAAAVNAAEPRVDDDSVDITLMRRTVGTPRTSPRLDVQVKATAADCLRADHLSFPLPKKNFDDLRESAVMVPRILVVVLMPDLIQDWTTHSEANLALFRCGYWLSLRGMPATGNVSTKTVYLSRLSTFSPHQLNSIFDRLAKGGSP